VEITDKIALLNERQCMTGKSSRIIRLQEVQFRTSLPRSSIYDLIKKGLFPKQIKLMARSVGWLESEIDEWIDEKTKPK
jgi:prophage regulatory protein